MSAFIKPLVRHRVIEFGLAFARVSVCGQIAHYNAQGPELGPRLLRLILVKQLRVEGFIVSRFAERFPEGVAQMAHWLKEGRLQYREYVMNGSEQLRTPSLHC